MCGRAYDPRFLFTWPSAKSAVMGGAQLAGVLSIVGRAAAEARGQAVRRGGRRRHARRRRGARSRRSRCRSSCPGMLYDDGVIDPRDTRTVLGMCLSAIDNAPDRGRRRLRRLPDVSAMTAMTVDHPTPGRQPRRDRPPRLRAPAARLGIGTVAVLLRRRRATARTSREADARGAAARRHPGRHLPARRPDHRRGAGAPAPTPSTPATASSPRTPTSPRRCATPG